MFGSTGTSLFGSNTAANNNTNSNTVGIFGSSSQPATTSNNSTSLFGNSSAKPTTSLFGNTAQPSTSLFGNTAQPATTTTNSLFGNTAQPATTTNSLFGNTTQPATTTNSLFGNTAQPATTTNSLFGNNARPATTTTSLFGNTSQPATTTNSLFGNTSQPAATSTGLFGNNQQTNSMQEPGTASNYQCPPNENPELWQQAQRDSPDPNAMVPALVVGYEGLNSRISCQTDQLLAYETLINNLDEKISALSKKISSATLIKLDSVSRKQQEVEQRLLRLMKNLELLRRASHSGNFNYSTSINPSGVISTEEEMFRVRMEQLQMGLVGNDKSSTHQHTSLKQGLVELQNKLVALKAHHSRFLLINQENSTTSDIQQQNTPNQLSNIVEVLEMHKSGLVYLSDSVAKLNGLSETIMLKIQK
ncbi:Nuclear pore complex protein Nup98-Nup96 [Smittium culicis]|uniref:Nuclear pore complex protein Nup98-Nup96 n=1 Tax=Smittium culicis TaxID=133412 RepID=A0A1R1XS72_9FUNG|nr:Nuclear pore complex protein Nup98-Nup96 [Smittium culicis]